LIESFFELARDAWRSPELQAAASTLQFLSGVSGCFWLLSWIVGHWALLIHDILIAELADCFAILYNGALAIAFSAVIALSVAASGPQGLRWHQALGFVFVYFVLTAAYSDPASAEIDDYSVLGYLAGLGAYLWFAISPRTLDQPWIAKSHQVVVWMATGWVGALLSGYAGFTLVRIIWKGFRDWISPHPRIRVRRRRT